MAVNPNPLPISVKTRKTTTTYSISLSVTSADINDNGSFTPKLTPSPRHASTSREEIDQYDQFDYVNSSSTRLQPTPKEIYILGLGSVGKLIAHSLRGIANPPPITLLAHRKALYDEWQVSKKVITLEQDGYNLDASGFEMELALPSTRAFGVEIDDPDMIYNNEQGLLPHEAAAKIKRQQARRPAPEAPAQPDENAEPEPGVSNEVIHSLIVTVKAPRTVSALLAVKHRLRPESTICFLQNGMGILDHVNEHVFPDPETRPNYILGIVTHGANSPRGSSPFFAIHAGHGTIALGIQPRRRASQAGTGTATATATEPGKPTALYLMRTLTRTPVLQAVGLPPTEFLQQQLEKLAQNAVINPLTVLMDARNGSLLYNYAITRTMRLLLGEISLVARSLPELRGLPNVNTRFSPERLETMVVGLANATRTNVSSMLADVRHGVSSEIAFINGYVVRRGEEVGVQCVCNYMVVQMVGAKNMMIQRELQDRVPTERVDESTGERREG